MAVISETMPYNTWNTGFGEIIWVEHDQIEHVFTVEH